MTATLTRVTVPSSHTTSYFPSSHASILPKNVVGPQPGHFFLMVRPMSGRVMLAHAAGEPDADGTVVGAPAGGAVVGCRDVTANSSAEKDRW